MNSKWSFLIGALLINSCIENLQHMDQEKIAIERLINECYLEGALNSMDTRKMEVGYHKDFAIFFKDYDELAKLPLAEWIEMVEGYKHDDNKIEGLREFKGEIVQIDVTEDVAFVKLKLLRKEQLIFTDYITLLKFNTEWKIVTKIYHSHVADPWGTL